MQTQITIHKQHTRRKTTATAHHRRCLHSWRDPQRETTHTLTVRTRANANKENLTMDPRERSEHRWEPNGRKAPDCWSGARASWIDAVAVASRRGRTTNATGPRTRGTRSPHTSADAHSSTTTHRDTHLHTTTTAAVATHWNKDTTHAQTQTCNTRNRPTIIRRTKYGGEDRCGLASCSAERGAMRRRGCKQKPTTRLTRRRRTSFARSLRSKPDTK